MTKGGHINNLSSHEKTMSKRERELLDGVVQILVKTLDPGKVILFGSRGKGTAAHGSDFDIAVDRAKPSFKKEQIMDGDIQAIAGLYKIDIIYLD